MSVVSELVTVVLLNTTSVPWQFAPLAHQIAQFGPEGDKPLLRQLLAVFSRTKCVNDTADLAAFPYDSFTVSTEHDVLNVVIGVTGSVPCVFYTRQPGRRCPAPINCVMSPHAPTAKQLNAADGYADDKLNFVYSVAWVTLVCNCITICCILVFSGAVVRTTWFMSERITTTIPKRLNREDQIYIGRSIPVYSRIRPSAASLPHD